MLSVGTQPTPASELDHRLRRLAPGWIFAGRYRMENLVGRGGMGVVWRAIDETLDRPVALKFLVETLVHDPAAIDDLKRETRRALDLTHHNIVRVYDFVEDPIEGLAGIAMEFFPGQTLAARRTAVTARCFEPDTIVPWLTQLCDAMAYAHDKVGVIHRDLKPQNLMLDDRGELKITDFGIARVASDSLTRLSIGKVSGTPSYMSPQQARGESPTVTDDIYAIGSTVYELLTSRPPFWQGDISTQIGTIVPPKMSERLRELTGIERQIPAHWEETVAACLEKDATKRPRSAREFADRLGIALPATQFRSAPHGPGLSDSAPALVVDLAALQPDLDLESPTLVGAAIQRPASTSAREPISRIPPPLPAAARREEPAIPRWLWITGMVVILPVLAFTGGAVTRRMMAKPQVEGATAVVPAETASTETLIVPDAFPTIQAAIDGAREIKTISLRPGVYRESVTLKDGIRLVGESAGACKIVPPDGANTLLLVRGVRGCAIENLVLDGTDVADRSARVDGIAISDAEIKVSDCTIRGMTGTGILIHGSDTAAQIESNRVESSGLHGITLLRTGPAVALRKNEVRQNKGAGIHFNDGAAGTAEENACEVNGDSGILAEGVATSPILLSNRCTQNEKNGITFAGAARGSATDNLCDENRDSGLAGIGEGTAAEFAKNTARKNFRYGLFFANGADGTAAGNICEENRASGIGVTGTSTRPALSGNQLVRNQKFGIESANGASPRIGPENVFDGNLAGGMAR
jgi:serine/threonine protein kinase